MGEATAVRIRRSTFPLLAGFIVIGLLAAACGGSDRGADSATAQPSVEAAQDADAQDGADQGEVQFGDDNDDEGATRDQDDTAVEAEADSAVESEEDSQVPAQDADQADQLAPIDPVIGIDDPWEVAVLTVREGVQIVSAFDGPGGNEIRLFDQNPIDDVELEYPLFGTTEFGNPLSLLVVEYDPTATWAKVHVPIRPNGTTTWVATKDFTEARHSTHITIDLSDRMVTVFDGDDIELEQLAVVGSADLPTPVTRTYIDEKVPGATVDPAFGEWILSLAAFSETIGTAGGGGLPKLALHGTDQPDQIGQNISSGSIRVPNEAISFIADFAPLGTVVDIVP